MVAYTLTAANGSYAYAGNAASVSVGRVINAKSGRVTVIGFNTLLQHGFTDTPRAYEPTAYFGPVGLKTAGNFAFPAVLGTYAVTGFSASMAAARNLSAANAAFTYVGNSATLIRIAQLPALAGVYTLDGKPAAFADPLRGTAYIISVSPVRFAAQRKLNAGSRNYVLDGFGARVYESSFNYPDREVMRVGYQNKTMTVPENRTKTMYVEYVEDSRTSQNAQNRDMGSPNRNRG